MKKQTVFTAFMLSGFRRISCVTVLLFALGACGSGGDGDNGSDNGGPMGVAPQIKFLAADDGVNGTELWKTDGTAAGTLLVIDICPGLCPGILE